MSLAPRLLVGGALVTMLGLAGLPAAFAGAVPCDEYSQGCETPPPTGGVDVPGEGGATPTPDGTGTDGTGTDGTGTDGEGTDGEGTDDGGAGTDGAGSDGGSAGADAEGGALPFTGGEVATAAVLGLGAVGVGSLLLVGARRRSTPA